MWESICKIELVFFTWQLFLLVVVGAGLETWTVPGPAVEARKEERKERGVAEQHGIGVSTCLLLLCLDAGIKQPGPEEVGSALA